MFIILILMISQEYIAMLTLIKLYSLSTYSLLFVNYILVIYKNIAYNYPLPPNTAMTSEKFL